MIRLPRRTVTLALSGAMAIVLGGCATTPVPSARPSQVGTLTSALPASAAASPSPAGSAAGSAAACPVTTQAGLLPSDRLVNVSVSSTPTHDVLTFAFQPSTPGPGGPPRGTPEAADPPFSFAGSGESVAMLGQHVIQVRFTAMTLASESGTATYQGPTEFEPQLPALREAIQYDASEGIVGWYLGYDGPGCVTLATDGNQVSVAIAHPDAPAG